MGHVFISYDSEDGDFVIDVIRQLEDAGFRVWSQHAQLRAEGEWRESIDDAIREAFAMLVILAPKARDSEQVSYEWMFGLGVGVTVIPLLRQPITLPTRLSALNSLDFTDDAGLPWGKLIRRVQEAFDLDQNRSRDRRSPFPTRPPNRDRPSSFLDRARRASSRPRFDSGRESGREDWVNELDRAGRNRDIQTLLGALDDSNRDKRAHAATRLGDIGAKEAIPALIARLRDDDFRVREDAARALGKLKAAGAVLGLLEAVRQSRPGPFSSGQNFFIDALREIGVLAVPVLVDALSDEDPRMRLQIVDLLGEIGEADAASALAGALRDPEWRVRWRAADALGKLGDHSAVPDLLALLTDDSKDVRVSSAWALGRIGHPSAVDGLVSLLHDREWRVRWGAAEALWEIGEPAVPHLVTLLSDPDDYVRRAAMRALAQIGAPAIEPLIITLNDPNWDVRWAAAGALHEIGDPAVPALVKALEADSWLATWAAAETLKRIGTKEAMQAVDQWRVGRDPEAPEGDSAPFGSTDPVSNALPNDTAEPDVENGDLD